MKTKYDAIVELGYRFDLNWQLPKYFKDSLLITAGLYKKKVAETVVVCGKWSIEYDRQHIVPPFTEAAEMRKVLFSLGVPPASIIMEEDSKDTIGNAYFVKTKVIDPRGMRKFLVVCTDFHAVRVRYIFHKIFADTYTIDYELVPTPYGEHVDKFQQVILQRQIKFLSPMKDGDDVFLKGKLYSDPYFQ